MAILRFALKYKSKNLNFKSFFISKNNFRGYFQSRTSLFQ